ncbi:MAG: hypothetical protein KDD40_12050, partial [Bdellovibrionales bacterium]|nr:hypothetical protein [Bdellovibrionales bacterium]
AHNHQHDNNSPDQKNYQHDFANFPLQAPDLNLLAQNQHEDHSHAHDGHCCHSAPTTAIGKLLSIFHLAVDGEHQHIHSVSEFIQSYKYREQWQKVLQNLNFADMTTRAIRAYNIESQSAELKEHAKNLAFIFPFSHGLEVMAAPVFVTVGTMGDWPGLVVASGGAILSLIALPGLDPLCMLILASYPLKPVNKTINTLRSSTEYLVKGIFTVTGVKSIVRLAKKYKDPGLFLEQIYQSIDNSGAYTFNVHNDYSNTVVEISNTQTQQLEVKLTFSKDLEKQESDRTYSSLEKVELFNFTKDTQKLSFILQTLRPLFSWNVSKALNEISENLQNSDWQRMENLFYVNDVQVNENLTLHFKPQAIHWNPVKYWFTDQRRIKSYKNILNDCLKALSSK